MFSRQLNLINYGDQYTANKLGSKKERYDCRVVLFYFVKLAQYAYLGLCFCFIPVLDIFFWECQSSLLSGKPLDSFPVTFHTALIACQIRTLNVSCRQASHTHLKITAMLLVHDY